MTITDATQPGNTGSNLALGPWHRAWWTATLLLPWAINDLARRRAKAVACLQANKKGRGQW